MAFSFHFVVSTSHLVFVMDLEDDIESKADHRG